MSWSRRDGRLVSREAEPDGDEVWSETAGLESTLEVVCEATSLAGKTGAAAGAAAGTEAETSEAAGSESSLAATACTAEALGSAETMEGVTTGLSALAVNAAGRGDLPDESGSGNPDTQCTGRTVKAWSRLREQQTEGRVYHVGGATHVLLPGGLLSRTAVGEAVAGESASGTGVDYTMACLQGGGLGVGYEVYSALDGEAWFMAVRLDSMSSEMRQVLWDELAPGWRDNLKSVQQRHGEPGWRVACVVGPRECTRVDASEYESVARMHFREAELHQLRHHILLALASEEAYLQKVAFLTQASGSANIRRALRLVEDRAPGPYQGVASHAVAEHLVGVGSAVDADTLRAVGQRAAMDDLSLSSTSSSSSSDTSGSAALMRRISRAAPPLDRVPAAVRTGERLSPGSADDDDYGWEGSEGLGQEDEYDWDGDGDE